MAASQMSMPAWPAMSAERQGSGQGRRVQSAGGDRRVGARAERPRDLHGECSSDRSERGVRRHGRWRVSQHRPRQVVPAHELPRTRACRSGRSWSMPTIRSWSTPAARRSACIAARTPARRGAPARSRDAGSRGDAVRLPRHADGAASVASRHDLRRAGSERRDAHHRWRRKLEAIAAPT